MATWPERWPDDRSNELAVLDHERERLVARLRTECTEGHISLERFSDLIGDVYAARTQADLERLAVALLPQPPPQPAPPPAAPAPRARRPGPWLLAVFGSSNRTGRYRLEDNTTALAVFGDCAIDLTGATIDDDEVIVNAVSVFGSVTVIVPEGLAVAIEGASIFGSRRCDLDAQAVHPGAPVVRVRAWAVFGDVRVRAPRKSRG